MERVILQPTSNAGARQHYVDTISNLVPLDRIRPHVSADVIRRLEELYPSGSAGVWGVVPGKKSVNVGKWEKVSVGDITLFCRDGRVISSGVVTLKTRSHPLAVELWGRDGAGATWEYIYFVDEILNQNIPYLHLNRAAGYEDNNVVQGFNVLDELKSAKIISSFDLGSKIHIPNVSVDDYERAIKERDKLELDVVQKVFARTEQSFLRKIIFGDSRIATCCICGNTFPVEFLVAAHIKKRCKCDDAEKRDFRSIVVPMCSFGCDDLYEKGYIGVENGIIKILKEARSSRYVQERLQSLDGARCAAWNRGTSKYFAWHMTYHSGTGGSQ